MLDGLRSVIRPVRTPTAKSVPRQIWEMLYWGSRAITTPNDYRAHGLYVQGKTWKDAMRFLSLPQARALVWPLNEDPELVENKLLFESHFRSVGLSVPNTLAVLGRVPFTVEMPVLTLPSQIREFLEGTVRSGEQLVIKPIDRWGGAGITVMTGIDGEDFILSNGDRCPIAEVVSQTSTGVWLVQQRIMQHSELAELNHSSLNTLRLGTYRRKNGDVEIVFAGLRVGRNGAQLDSSSLGGFAVRIDIRTGVFADYGRQLPKYSLSAISRHPDSNVSFSGRVYPQWDKVLADATAFAKSAGRNRFIGWDIASTEYGPVFVEGNHTWDVQGAQIGSAGMLTDEFVAVFNEDEGPRIDLMRPPAVDPFRALTHLREAILRSRGRKLSK